MGPKSGAFHHLTVVCLTAQAVLCAAAAAFYLHDTFLRTVVHLSVLWRAFPFFSFRRTTALYRRENAACRRTATSVGPVRQAADSTRGRQGHMTAK